MAQSSIMLGTPTRERAVPPSRLGDVEWRVLGITGATFVVLGLLDVSLVWFPPTLGSPEWEFASITATFNTLPVTVLGATLLVSSGIARQRPAIARTGGILLLMLAMLVVVGAVIYATTVPIALKGINNPVVRLGVYKAMTKTIAQCILYPILFIWVGLKGLRASRTA